LIPNPKARLLDQVREVTRFHHYSLHTKKAYLHWIRRYLGVLSRFALASPRPSLLGRWSRATGSTLQEEGELSGGASARRAYGVEPEARRYTKRVDDGIA
jgi:hypothetical protein